MQPNNDMPLKAFLDSKRLLLPVGFQKIYIKDLVPKSIEDKLAIRNAYYKSRFNAQSSMKPISKIISE